MKCKDLISIGIGLIVLAMTLIAIILIIFQIGTIYENLPPPNSTEEWKMILNSSECHWYNVGCQKLACVIDCSEINKNAGELICVC